MSNFLLDQRSWNDANHVSPCVEGGIHKRSH